MIAAQIDQPVPNRNYLQVPNPHPYIHQSQPLPNANATFGAVGNYPMACTCPHCHQPVVTRAEKDVGVAVWLSALVLCIFGCFCGCCLIPFCIDDIKVRNV